MRFELSIALKYLLPRRSHLSTSIISLISILVISLVVWLTIVFLSVTEGMEKKWLKEIVTLHAPMRLTPTEAYYHSYYHQIDALALSSGFTHKSIGEKLNAPASNPYNADLDSELPELFPEPDVHADGQLKDIVQETWKIIAQLPFAGLSPSEYEMAVGHLRLDLLRDGSSLSSTATETHVNQVSYVASFDPHQSRNSSLLLPPSASDWNNILHSLSQSSSPQECMQSLSQCISITQLKTAATGWPLPRALLPSEGKLQGYAIVSPANPTHIQRILLPLSTHSLEKTQHSLQDLGYQPLLAEIDLHADRVTLSSPYKEPLTVALGSKTPLYVEGGALFHASLQSPERSTASINSLGQLRFSISGQVQNIPIQGEVPYTHLEISATQPVNSVSTLSLNALGDSVYLPKTFRESGVLLGDKGSLSYYAETPTSLQEMRVPIHVAGFYDPGMLPIGNRLLLADSSLLAVLRSPVKVADPLLGNGIQVWLKDLNQAGEAKIKLQQALQKAGLDRYWSIQTFADYEFSRPIVQQLKSDKTLFTLITLIILIVACSNIISMLILLVNDKRKEIGILQSMGASSTQIALIFGFCGCFTGILSSCLGTVAALFTLRYLQSLVNFLSFLQGHEAFHKAFYGTMLPNELSSSALLFVLTATSIISILAGTIPALRAAKIQPTQILRAE